MASTRLSDKVLDDLKKSVHKPRYDRRDLKKGVVHIGPGAFFRAHQAHYFDLMNHIRPDFGISAISLRSNRTEEALRPQNGLYFLVELDVETTVRAIGALTEVVTAPSEPKRALECLTDPETRYVTTTVTEKGYCLNSNGELWIEHDDVVSDLEGNDPPRSLIGWLCSALRYRFQNSLGGFTVLCCDNIPSNGVKLKSALLTFLVELGDLELRDWVESEVSCPRTMVDSITPATDDALRRSVVDITGVEDAWPIQRERFTQWVIEGQLGSDDGVFEQVGVTLADDIRPYEQAKLRLLNGAHSSLAYMGILKGYQTVEEALKSPDLSSFVEQLLLEDVLPTLPAAGHCYKTYIADILERFRNPAIAHQLEQIAWDGTQKLPVRLLDTVSDRLDHGAPIARLATSIAAWMQFVRRKTELGEPITDPLASELGNIATKCSGDPENDVPKFLALSGVFQASLTSNPHFVRALKDAYSKFGEVQP